MNILVIGKFYEEGFARHIAETLEVMGHSIARYEFGNAPHRLKWRVGQRLDQIAKNLYLLTDNIPAIRSWRARALWKVAEKKSTELVIVCHDFLWSREVDELKCRTDAKVVMWFPDSLINIGKGHFMNASYDALFFKDPYIVNSLKEVLASPVYYLPECFNPRKHWLPEENIGDDSKYRCDITIVGNSHAYRIAFFKRLAACDVKQWGSQPPLWLSPDALGGMFQGRQVLNHEKVRAFRGAKIVINNLHYSEIWGVNVRAFEVAGSGSFQMVDWRPGLGDLFEDGLELVSFRGIQDLKEKIEYWLPRDKERRAIASAGMKRAHSEHTYRHRLTLLLETVAGTQYGFPVPRIECELVKND
tara:strand:+ start:63 stop:1139 length:1077 start_codon:yes stop_codon:yes gene_type:complete